MTENPTKAIVVATTLLLLTFAFVAAVPAASAHEATCGGPNPTSRGVCLIICDATHLTQPEPGVVHDCD